MVTPKDSSPSPTVLGKPIEQVGRYQLLAAEHLIVGKKSIYNNKDLFRIDTITGKTEVYMSGGGQDFWSEIHDDASPGPPAVAPAK